MSAGIPLLRLRSPEEGHGLQPSPMVSCVVSIDFRQRAAEVIWNELYLYQEYRADLSLLPILDSRVVRRSPIFVSVF